MPAGRERCFACGRRVRDRGYGRERKSANPLVFIVAGAVVLVSVVTLFILRPKQSAAEAEQKQQAELTRVQDSVRRANVATRTGTRRSGEVERLNKDIEKTAFRFEQVREQVVGAKPTPEQEKLIAQINAGLLRMRMQVAAVELADEVRRKALADSVREGARTVRSFISDLTRAPKNR